MLRYLCLPLLGATLFAADPALRLTDVSIGRNLEAPVKVSLDEPAPDEGVDITIRSGDPKRVLVSAKQDRPGSESLVIRVRQGYTESPEFWLQGLDSSGTVTYTAEANHYSKASATATLTPSAIVIVGPLKAPKFVTTTGAEPKKLTVYSVRLDASLKNPEIQPVAGGLSIPVQLTSSNPAAGKLTESSIVMPAGVSDVRLMFQPAGEGQTTLAPKAPEGFAASQQYASVTAVVTKPGIAISDQLFIGQNLQVGGVLALGEPAPPGGVTVTLTSEDPSKLLISDSEKKIGSKTLQISFATGGTTARYYLQALADSGTISYTASAPGFRSRTADVTLSPSGIVLTPFHQGPPDEGQVLRTATGDGVHKFAVNLSKPEPVRLVAWTAQLDPITHRSADITVQPLRPGVSLEIQLKNTNPEIGRVPERLKIDPGSDHAMGDFVPLGPGKTEISVVTPAGFIPSANSTTVLAYVQK